LKDSFPTYEYNYCDFNYCKLKNIDSSKYQAVYIPGGHGAMFDLADDAVVKSVIAQVIVGLLKK
jgi:enhancing lycopene biosynthesis protein 2